MEYIVRTEFIRKKLPTSLSKEASGNSLNPAQALPIKVKSKDETPPLILLYRVVLQSQLPSRLSKFVLHFFLSASINIQRLEYQAPNANMAAPAKYTLSELPYAHNVSIPSSLKFMLNFSS